MRWSSAPHIERPAIDLPRTRGAPYPRFPVKLSGFRGLHAPFLKERRIRSPCQRRVQEIRGISLVFREMWGMTVGRPFTTWTDTSRSAVESHISIPDRHPGSWQGNLSTLCYIAG